MVTRQPPLCIEGETPPAEFHYERHHCHDSVFLAHVPNASVVGPTGLVMTDSSEPIEQSLLLGRLNTDAVCSKFRLTDPEVLFGHYYTITSQWSAGYAHWLFDALPRLHALDLIPNQDVRIVVPETLTALQRDSLQALGINPSRCLPLNHRHLKFQCLYVPSFMGTTGNPHPLGIAWLRKRFLGNDILVEGTERIYISRRSASRRRVLNEKELEPILLKHGFRIVECEKLSFPEQVELFSHASMVVGLHGAGLANLLFAPAGCRVLEILTPPLRQRLMYYSIAGLLAQPYSYLDASVDESHSNSHGDDGFADAIVYPAALDHALSLIVRE